MIKNNFKRLSIKEQLTIWYTLIIFAVTAVLFLSFQLLTKKYLVYETDRSLSTHAAQIAYSVSLNTTNLRSTQTQNILNLGQKEIPGILAEIVDFHGVDTKGEPSSFKELSALAIKNNYPVFTEQKIGDMTMRVIAYPIKNAEVPLGSVIMGHPIDIYQKTLAQLRNIGVILLLFLVVPSILIGYFLARSATEPITKLGANINKITSENLARKVNLSVGSKETELLVSNFNALLDRLDKAFNLERQFLGEMAHEIKTPLAVMKSNSEITLSKERSAEGYQDSIKQTLSQINKLSNNMASLMDFAWSQSSELSKTFNKIDISQLLSEICNVARYMALPKNIQVKSNIDAGVLVLGKEEKLYQAIYNVVDNAIKFTPKKGKVFIELSKQEGYALIKISDSGVGIEVEKQKDIFSRFYRTEKNMDIAGHGLGLAISESIIKAHGGLIAVESAQGKGTTFTISLKLDSGGSS